MSFLVPLLGHMQAIHRGMQIEGLTYPSNDLEYPFGGMGLAAAVVQPLYCYANIGTNYRESGIPHYTTILCTIGQIQ